MLTDYFINNGLMFFASGWTQFAGGFFVAFMTMLLFGRPFIAAMRAWQKKGQPISENVPDAHRKKAGTPTMGGILIVFAILLGGMLFMPMYNPTGWIALASLVMFGVLGFVDDYKKVTSQSKKASNGLSPLTRLVVEGVFVGNWCQHNFTIGHFLLCVCVLCNLWQCKCNKYYRWFGWYVGKVIYAGLGRFSCCAVWCNQNWIYGYSDVLANGQWFVCGIGCCIWCGAWVLVV